MTSPTAHEETDNLVTELYLDNCPSDSDEQSNPNEEEPYVNSDREGTD